MCVVLWKKVDCQTHSKFEEQCQDIHPRLVRLGSSREHDTELDWNRICSRGPSLTMNHFKTYKSVTMLPKQCCLIVNSWKGTLHWRLPASHLLLLPNARNLKSLGRKRSCNMPTHSPTPYIWETSRKNMIDLALQVGVFLKVDNLSISLLFSIPPSFVYCLVCNKAMC